MKEIGEALKEQREAIGISLEEAANDLKLKVEQIEAIEAGDKNAFKEISSLKYFVRDYSKYLGLNYEDMIDDFNEFLFDYTSKIPVAEIEKAKSNGGLKKEFSSPYTNTQKDKKSLKVAVGIGVIVLVLVLVYFIASSKLGNDFHDDNVTYVIRR